MKQKLLYIVPHLSTGGMPQYVLKQIEEFKNKFEIILIEYSNISDIYTVQKDKIKNLVKFYSLGNNKEDILRLIEKINPNIIHFQELPESFIDFKILENIYSQDRNYFIIITTHSSLSNPNFIFYLPDKFILVNKWSKQKFEESEIIKKWNIQCDVWEYPIEEKSLYNLETLTPNKIDAKIKLDFDLDDDYFHILNVGLFTPGKNQKEIFEIAERFKNKKVKFHFVGNQAGNFEEYWKPLMENKPDNCIVWGERNDVELFYQACDLFYFSSNFELNPLVIKEALSYKLPCLIKKLPTYLNDYDNNSLINYIDNNLDKTYNIIKKFIKNDKKIQLIHLRTNIKDEREIISKTNLSFLKNYNIDYKEMINPIYDGPISKMFCRRPEEIGKSINKRHYGCYLAHTEALEEINENYDYTIICECDAFINIKYEEFINILNKAIDKCEKENVYFVSFANNKSARPIEKIDKNFSEVWHQDLAHCYLIPNKLKNWYLDRIKDSEWDVADLWYNHIFCHHREKRYLTNKNYVIQYDGYSLLDNEFKKWSER